MSSLIDVDAVGGSATTQAFFDLNHTNSAATTGLDRDNLMVEIQSNGTTKGSATLTFPPRPDITLDPNDSGIYIDLRGGAFSSAFGVKATMFGVDMTFTVQYGLASDYNFAPINAGVTSGTFQAACANGWDLVLTVADAVTTAEWGSWLNVYATYIGDITGAPTVTHAPPLRQYPRSDGLGASSARRLWPLSPSVQASNRRVGGYL